MPRSPQMQAFMDGIFPDQYARIKEGKCPFCGFEINMEDFDNDLERKEFEISGICSDCQKRAFAPPPDSPDHGGSGSII